MKTEQLTLITSITAAATLTKNLFVGFDGALCSADAKALGVCNADTLIGEQMPISVSGIALVYSGGAVTVGTSVSSDSAGKAVASTVLSATVPSTGTAVTSSSAQPEMDIAGSVLPQAINGFALDVASGADELIRVLIK
ncbi:MAG: DUF2190 family protein [Bacteroidetes bacterium]|nr:DUF2190 family protein [Bacteroidota bacterium]MBU1115007.1 DUF2190 family protein [Bacteroidota bacterium]MBU1799499.1 DUF2190 family protein [Bacteroidota bacterium]